MDGPDCSLALRIDEHCIAVRCTRRSGSPTSLDGIYCPLPFRDISPAQDRYLLAHSSGVLSRSVSPSVCRLEQNTFRALIYDVGHATHCPPKLNVACNPPESKKSLPNAN